MIAQFAAGRRQILLAEPELKKWQRGINEALKAGILDLPQSGLKYLALGPEHLIAGRDQVSSKNLVPLLVLEGPTSFVAKRLPASLILFPFVDTGRSGFASYRSLADAVVQRVACETATLGSGLSTVATWKAESLSCMEAGETQNFSSRSRSLAALLCGEETSEDPFWNAVSQSCLELNFPLESVLQRLLSQNTLWLSSYSGETIGFEAATQAISAIQALWQANGRPGHCYGAQYWNHPTIGAAFSGKGGEVSFHETQTETVAAAIADGGIVLSWAGRSDTAFEEACAREKIPLVRIEDGFLRSVGLGAGTARGAMLAADDLGIYYDPSRPSRLEVLLKDHDLTPAETERGRKLVDLVRSARVSKYNFGKPKSFAFPADREKILIPGQVADDAAIRKSKSATIDCVNTPNVNLDLLKLVRTRHPDAYLIFKPHPDVETGLRKGKVVPEDALKHADEIAGNANIIDLIEAVDKVETFSSLSGFEALLRGKPVTVHGAPFYAGWGLTDDLTKLPGRGRTRNLPELVYLALVKYARTVDPVSLLPCAPEFLVQRLVAQRQDRKHLFVTAIKRHASWLGRKLGI